jgi:hypothetical protein
MKRLGLFALLALGVCDVMAADYSLGRPVRVITARNIFANVATGDFNGDGRDDLAATAELTRSSTHRVSLVLQRPDGTLAEPVHLALPYIPNSFQYPVAFLDLEHDGTEEIVVGGSGISVVRSDGAGGLSAIAYPTRALCEYLTSGDIDGDGTGDLVCHDWKETATVFPGDGNGGFRASFEMRTPVGTYYYDWKHMRLADVTGDGRQDLLIAAGGVRSFFVFPNNGLGGFWPSNVYPQPWSASKAWSPALEALDLDGDGAKEVVTVSPDMRPGSSLNVYRRGENGYLALSERIATHDSPTALITGDVDGDGDGELIVGHFTFNTVTVAGSGGKGLASQTRYDLPGFGTDLEDYPRQGHSMGLALGDLNHDGCKDLAAATYSGVVVLYGCRPAVHRMPVYDFDGDGISDLLWRYHTGETFLWQSADVEAWHACFLVYCARLIGMSWSGQAVGDFDGDGNSDMFWRDAASGGNLIWDRALFTRTITGVASQDWQVVGAGDFDGDSHSDLLWRNTRTGVNAIWRSADSTTPQAVASVTDQAWKVAGVGDFDGDGRSDILWRNAATGSNTIWRSGRNDQSQAVTTSGVQWKVVGVGDFNGDRRDDIAWRNPTTGANAIWPSASGAMAIAVSTVADQAWTVAAVADYSGDGRADLMWRNSSTGANVVWRSGDSRTTQVVATMSPDVWLVQP